MGQPKPAQTNEQPKLHNHDSATWRPFERSFTSASSQQAIALHIGARDNPISPFADCSCARQLRTVMSAR
jgi:hypothetical protein